MGITTVLMVIQNILNYKTGAMYQEPYTKLNTSRIRRFLQILSDSVVYISIDDKTSLQDVIELMD